MGIVHVITWCYEWGGLHTPERIDRYSKRSEHSFVKKKNQSLFFGIFKSERKKKMYNSLLSGEKSFISHFGAFVY